jgi:hypothetical protein
MTEKNTSEPHKIGEFYIDNINGDKRAHIVAGINVRELDTGETGYDYHSPCGTIGYSYDKWDPENEGCLSAIKSEFVKGSHENALALIPIEQRCPTCSENIHRYDVLDYFNHYHPENDPNVDNHYDPFTQ